MLFPLEIYDTKMILEKCVGCKKCLFCAIKTTKNQGKTVYRIGEKQIGLEWE